MTRPKAEVTVTTVVAVDPMVTFEIFTQEIDAWWRRGPRHRFSDGRAGVLRFEPGVGGRLLEEYDAGDVWEIGRVLAWEPGERLSFEWRFRGFAPEETSEVEVRFEPTPRGTRVTVEHRGLTQLPKDHPARRGLDGEAFTSMIALWWGDIVTGLRAYAKAQANAG